MFVPCRSGVKPDADITQSETYKMIHGLDQPKKRPTVTIPSKSNSKTRLCNAFVVHVVIIDLKIPIP